MHRSLPSVCALLLGACLALPLSAASPPAPVTLERLEWLLGSWVTGGDAWQTFERWERQGDNVFRGLGGNLEADGGSARILETLHLLHIDGTLYYLAKVEENPLPTIFPLVELTGDSAVFANPAHDFPTRLEYRRTGGGISVRISGSNGEGYTLSFIRPAESARLPTP